MAKVSDVDRSLMRGDIEKLEGILKGSAVEATPRVSRGLLEKILDAAQYFVAEDSRKNKIVEQLGIFVDTTSRDLKEVQQRVEAAVIERDNLREENAALKTRISEYAVAYGSLDTLADSAENLAAVLQDEVPGDEPLPWEDELQELAHRLDGRPTLEILPGEMPASSEALDEAVAIPETIPHTV